MTRLELQLAAPSRRLAWSRLVAALALSGLLAACVTLPGAPNAGGSGDSVQAAISSGVSALTDFFSPEVREFKRLVTEGKMDDALAFVKEKSSVFEERYQANASAPAEFVALARHVLEVQYRPSLVQAKAALTALGDLASSQTRTQADVAWDNGRTLSLEMGGHVLNKITTVWRDDIKSLEQAQASFKEQAQAQKLAYVAGMLDEVLISAKDSYPYVGDVSLSPSDFADSPAFQAAALAKIKTASGRREFESLTRRLRQYLSPDSRATLDEQFVERVRTEFMTDGRISLEELGELSGMTTPLGNSPSALKGLVKVGAASLVQRSGAREFPVNTQKDLPFDLENASDALLKERNGAAFDYVYVLSVANATARREGGSARAEPSQYRAGTDREPNPAYARARQRLSQAESTLRDVRAKAAQASQTPCPPGSRTCLFALAAIQYGLSSAESEASAARSALASTPFMLEKPRMSNYRYRVMPQTVAKEVSAVAVLWDVKGRQAWVMPVEHKTQRSFDLVQGVHPEDPDGSSITSRADKEQDIGRFVREGVELSLRAEFSSSHLDRARLAAANDADAVLALLSDAYERTVPKDDPPTVGRVFRLR